MSYDIRIICVILIAFFMSYIFAICMLYLYVLIHIIENATALLIDDKKVILFYRIIGIKNE